MNKNLSVIKKLLRQELPFLKKDFHVEDIGIFGSIVKGSATNDSDIDILVDFSTTPGLFKFIELEEYLSGILHHKVDLVTKKAIKQVVKEEILHSVSYV